MYAIYFAEGYIIDSQMALVSYCCVNMSSSGEGDLFHGTYGR